jgi:hypothetical protein
MCDYQFEGKSTVCIKDRFCHGDITQPKLSVDVGDKHRRIRVHHCGCEISKVVFEKVAEMVRIAMDFQVHASISLDFRAVGEQSGRFDKHLPTSQSRNSQCHQRRLAKLLCN